MPLNALRRSSLAIVALGLCAGLAACGSGSSPSSSSSSSPSGAPVRGATGAAKKGKLVVADSSVANSLDPDGPSAAVKQNLTAVNNTYENLVGLLPAPNPSSLGGGNTINASKVGPALASSWKIAGNHATFTLRKGVKDQYGNELTSADVVWSYHRAMALKATGSFIYTTEAKITGVKALGKYKVQYTTSGPSPLLQWAMTAHYATIYDSSAVKKHASSSDPWGKKWLSNHTAGFGAYNVASFTPGQSLKLTPSKTYWNGPAENAIDLVSIPDNSNRFTALKKGTINVALDLTPDQYKQAKTTSGLHVYAVRGNNLVSMFPNSDVPQLKNVKVRQALQYATPQDQIVKQIYQGFGFPVKSIATSYSTGYTDKYWHYDYDPSKAKSLMQQAGYGKGFSSKLYYPSDSETLTALAPILQSAYAQIGIKVKLVPESASTLITQAFGSKNLPMYLTDQASSVLPDIGNVGALYQTTGFANINKYSNPAFDAAAKVALGTTDQAKRMKAFDDMQRIAAEDPVYIAVAGLDGLAATSANVGGYWYLPDQTNLFRTLTVSGS